MSSKSKKKTLPSAKTSTKDVKVAEVVHDQAAEHLGLDEVIDVPKGTSPLKWVVMVAVVIGLTVIFAIDPSTVQRATQGGSGTYMSWTSPSTDAKVEMSRGEFLQEMRKLDYYLKMFRRDNLKEEDVAIFILLGELASDAGIAISDDELRERLTEISASSGTAALEAHMKRSPGRTHGFQETVRALMRGQRYQQLLGTLATNVDPVDVEQTWRDGHQEYAYDYVGLEVAGLIEDALTEVPEDAGLATWLAELSTGEQTQFYEPPRVRAELIGFLIGGDNTAEGLLARFPEEVEEPVLEDSTTGTEDGEATEAEFVAAEDDDSANTAADEDGASSLTKLYYDSVRFSRFMRPTPAEGEPALDYANRFFPFDEVEEIAAREAPIYFALNRWLEDVETREATGTPVDLAAEASELGLSYLPAETAYSRSEWAVVEGWGDAPLGGRIERMPEGALSTALIVQSGGLFVARQKERIEGYLPELETIRDKVVTAWADQRAGELAIERLEALRDSFALVEEATNDSDAEASTDGVEDANADDTAAADDTGSDADTASGVVSVSETEFAVAAAALGLDVGRRPYFEKSVEFSQDPDKSKPGHMFISSRSNLESLEAGELSSPELNPTKTVAYLVRALGKRDPEAWRLSPDEFEQAKLFAEYKASLAFSEANFSTEALFEKYDVVLENDSEE